ncbi:hypothetical protein [Alienimonas sp. DA493]|uniref:hypothetical protein n=1 Tax=Alienimonas sp. DA493 TaxID=3373605 RepID=UPI003754ECC2
MSDGPAAGPSVPERSAGVVTDVTGGRIVLRSVRFRSRPAVRRAGFRFEPWLWRRTSPVLPGDQWPGSPDDPLAAPFARLRDAGFATPGSRRRVRDAGFAFAVSKGVGASETFAGLRERGLLTGTYLEQFRTDGGVRFRRI